MKILIIEDEVKVVAFLKKGLEEEGFEVEFAYDGQMGERFAVKGNHDLIILDLVLPLINGIELCRKIRSVNASVPILMLTALGTTEDKLIGFDAGADDYLTKPFEFRELLARIKALSKRSTGVFQKSKTISFLDLDLDQDRKKAIRAGKNIDLTAKEFMLLEFLMLNKGRVVSRAEIAERVWEITFDTGTNVVDVYINILRKKIDKGFDKKLIHTRIGHGYLFDEI